MWPAVPTTRRLRDMGAIVAWSAAACRRHRRLKQAAALQALPALSVHLLELRWHLPALPLRRLEIRGIHHRLSSKVIVRDHVGIFFFRHSLDPLDPRLELFGRIEIVVALPTFIVRKPFFVVPAVKADVSQGAGDDISGLHRIVEQRLVDVDECDVALIEKMEELVVLKCRVTNLQRFWVLLERTK